MGKLKQPFNGEIRKAIEELQKRLARLTAIANGELEVRKVWVKQHTVPEHTVARHQRLIARKRRRG